jgi:hypothetical protein
MPALTERKPRRRPCNKDELETEDFRSGKTPMIGSHATAPIQRPASVTPAGLSAVSRIPPCRDFRGNKVEAENRPDSQ